MWYIVTSQYIPEEIARGDKILVLVKSEEERERFEKNKKYQLLSTFIVRNFDLSDWIYVNLQTMKCFDIARVQIDEDPELFCSLLTAFNHLNRVSPDKEFNFCVRELFYGERYFTPYLMQLLAVNYQILIPC